MLLENYCFVKFHKFLMSGSLENRSFPLKQPVTIWGSNAHATFSVPLQIKTLIVMRMIFFQ